MSAIPPVAADWQSALAARLAAGERVVGCFEPDLDARLRFARKLLVLTDRRLLSIGAPEADARDAGDVVGAGRADAGRADAGRADARDRAGTPDGRDEWPLVPGLVLGHHDHAGVGSLELADAHGRLAVWHYTIGRHPAMLRLVEAFDRLQAAARDGSTAAEPSLEDEPAAGQEEETAFGDGEDPSPPSTWTLLRLWRFAHPYRGRLLAGFLLTLASTAATLVPPYLTMPLMDDILIPFQNGVPIDTGLVTLYLGGLLVAALLAWALGWARTWMLARVSERIGADLRTTTYAHLLKLSLEYFGGKRTGDLMARIGSETDRINLFLSLHLLDFATDV
ncbi:MAG: hypothetical protein GX644_02760, partial [Limnobacter sp.]|nr:hypothetical protein [Limnobacter sp.]